MKCTCAILLLLLHDFTLSRSDQFEVVGPDGPLVVEAGEDLILPCSLKPNISAVDMTVEWIRLISTSDSLVHLYENGVEHKDQVLSYRGRTSLFKEELQEGNTSLKLSRVKVSDEGKYKCLIQTEHWSDNITVQVNVEGNTLGKQRRRTYATSISVCASVIFAGLLLMFWGLLGKRETEKRRISTLIESIRRQYAVDVILDPDTANPYLILSDDGKRVRCGMTPLDLPDNPERFAYQFCVLGKEGFSSGRFYYEVQVTGKTNWRLGVARESINRKRDFEQSFKDGLWSLSLSQGDEYKALDSHYFRSSLKQKPQKVGVFVDYEEGVVSFYDVMARSHIYSFTGQTFAEELYPYFNPDYTSGGNSAPLVITPVSHTE